MLELVSCWFFSLFFISSTTAFLGFIGYVSAVFVDACRYLYGIAMRLVPELLWSSSNVMIKYPVRYP